MNVVAATVSAAVMASATQRLRAPRFRAGAAKVLPRT
jgi:hypothetical protein